MFSHVSFRNIYSFEYPPKACSVGAVSFSFFLLFPFPTIKFEGDFLKISSPPFVAELHISTFNYWMYIQKHSHGSKKAGRLYGDSKASCWSTQVWVHSTGTSRYCRTAAGFKDTAKAVSFPLLGRQVSGAIFHSSSLECCWQTIFCFPFSQGKHLPGRWVTVFADYILIQVMNVQTMATKERSWLSVLCISSF